MTCKESDLVNDLKKFFFLSLFFAMFEAKKMNWEIIAATLKLLNSNI